MNSNFASTVYDPSKMELTGDMLQIVLKNLPAFHRYIYVLHTVCEYSVEQISRIFATTRIIENALDSERTNVDKIVTIARRKRSNLSHYSIQDFHADLVQAAACADVPASVDATVKLNVQSLCEPVQKAQRKKGHIILGTAGIAAILIVILLVVLSMGGSENPDVDLDNADPTLATEDSTEESTNPAEETDADIVASYYADIEIEGYGTITVALDAEAAPETVANFVSLAQSSFYDGLTFHRIIDGFMMQGGDPNGDGTGGNTDAAGNEINITGEFSANGFDNPLSHTAGAISMARADDYNSASSQFFIVHEDSTESLDGLYACFGYVTEGMDIVDAICTAAEPTDGNGTIAAEDQPVITSITIREVEESGEIADADAADATDSNDAAA